MLRTFIEPTWTAIKYSLIIQWWRWRRTHLSFAGLCDWWREAPKYCMRKILTKKAYHFPKIFPQIPLAYYVNFINVVIFEIIWEILNSLIVEIAANCLISLSLSLFIATWLYSILLSVFFEKFLLAILLFFLDLWNGKLDAFFYFYIVPNPPERWCCFLFPWWFLFPFPPRLSL